MKLLLAILGAILVSCNGMIYAGDNGQSFLTTYAAIATEKFRDLMKTGNATLGIPVMDPFELKQQSFEFTEEGLLDIRGLVRNLKVDELSTFSAIKADFSIIGIKINLHLFWDSIKFVTDYSMRGTLANVLSIYGLGKIEGEAQGLDINVQMSLSMRNGKPYVRTFKSEIKLEELDFTITGLFYDDEISKLLSKVISDMVPQLIDDYQVEFTTKVNALVTDFINDFIKDKSLKDLIALLG